MIKEALQYVVGLSETNITDIDGKKYGGQAVDSHGLRPKG